MMPSSPVVIALAVEVKNLFGISAAALVIRMRDLDIIGETAVQNVFRGVGRTWRTEEPCPLDRTEELRRFHRLCFRALAKNIVSKSKAAELLKIPVRDVERAMVGSVRVESHSFCIFHLCSFS